MEYEEAVSASEDVGATQWDYMCWHAESVDTIIPTRPLLLEIRATMGSLSCHKTLPGLQVLPTDG